MSYIEDIQNRRNQVRNNIAKGFGYEFVKAQDDELVEIEKAKVAFMQTQLKIVNLEG